MAASTLSSVAYIYKTKYHGQKPADLAMRDHPLTTMIKKEGGMTGLASGYTYAVRYGNPQGISGTFATAQSSASGSSGVQFVAPRRKKFGIITLDGESLMAARDNAGAFLDLVTQETDGILEEHGDDLSWQLYGDGNPTRGRRSSESSDVTTLTVADDARNFKVGMTVGASPNADGTSARSGTTAILSVDEDSGTIGLDTSAITSYADNDYLFRAGDTVATTVQGLQAIIPLTAPTSGDSFRGVDRSAHVRLLAGSRVNDTAATIEENAGLVAVKIAQASKRALRGKGVVMLNPINFWQVCRRLNAKVEYDGGGVKATYGFEGFDIATPAGTLRCISDPDCPTNRGFVLSLSSWCWKTLGDWVHLVQDDKKGPMLRVYNEDSIEARTRSMGNPLCFAPGDNGVFAI